MDTQFISIFLTFIFSLVAGFFYLSFVNQKMTNDDMEKKSSIAYLGIYIIISIAFCILYVTVYDPYTFKYDFSFYELLTVIFFTGLIFASYCFKKIDKIAPFILLLGCIAVSYFIPDTYRFFEPILPIWAEKAMFAAALFIFSLAYKYINSIDGILVSQTGSIGVGALGLAIVLNIPLIGAFGSVIFAVSLGLLFFNKYPAKIQINKPFATSLAFILGWFLIKIGEETSLVCSLFLIAFVLIEVSFSFVKKLTFLDKYKNIYANGFCMEASARGLYPDAIRLAVSKALILAVLLACFQTFAPNQYSVPLFGALALIWLLYRMQEWEHYGKSLKEMNKDTVEDIKENIDEIKKYINRN